MSTAFRETKVRKKKSGPAKQSKPAWRIYNLEIRGAGNGGRDDQGEEVERTA
jgi:hypothetical protein